MTTLFCWYVCLLSTSRNCFRQNNTFVIIGCTYKTKLLKFDRFREDIAIVFYKPFRLLMTYDPRNFTCGQANTRTNGGNVYPM